MINFISTFPPIMCGIGTYTSYLVNEMRAEDWRVTSFRQDELFTTDHTCKFDNNVSYQISLSHPHLPPFLEGELLWFEHAFGMWGRESPAFLQLVKEAKEKKKKVIASFHSIHFESDETVSGMWRKEENLLNNVLPWLDAITVFTDGAYRALSRAFPQYKDKIVVLRHGVHLHPQVSQEKAKERLLGYLINQANISFGQKQELKEMYPQFFSPETFLLGNFGFITGDKDPLRLYQLGQLLQDRIPERRVIALYIGRIQKRKDKKIEESLPILADLRSIHDGGANLFFEDYLPESIFPYAFRALDFSIFWSHNATQSGRMAHAQGTGTCVVGRRIEGIGETLDLAGLPSAVSLEDLAEKIGRLMGEPGLKKEAEKSSRHYAQEYSFEKQAKKHLLLEQMVRSGGELPVIDRTKPKITFILPRLALGKRDGLEEPPTEVTAFLNVAEDLDLYPPPGKYHKIPLQDGMPIPLEKMKETISWIKRNISSHKVTVFCRYGKGRSASVIIAYLCSIGFDYQEAVELVASQCPGINPLPGLAQTIRMALQ